VPAVVGTLDLDHDQASVLVQSEKVDATARILPVAELLLGDHQQVLLDDSLTCAFDLRPNGACRS
jgi:hypothetical protein